RKKLLINFGIGITLAVLTVWLPSGALVGRGASAERPGPSPKEAAAPRFRVPPGFVIEKVAGPPLGRYPLFAAFDDRGPPFIAEGTGTNLPATRVLKLKRQLGRIPLLEDPAGDARSARSPVFADDLPFPTGILWHAGFVYATSPPCLGLLGEKDGKATRREALV